MAKAAVKLNKIKALNYVDLQKMKDSMLKDKLDDENNGGMRRYIGEKIEFNDARRRNKSQGYLNFDVT